MRRLTLATLALLSAFTAFGATSLLAPLPIAEDTFAGEPGPLSDRPGGTGFSGPWIVQNASTAGYKVVADKPLEFKDLKSSPNRLIGGDQYQGAGRALDPSAGAGELFRKADDGNGGEVQLLGKIGTPFYLATLLRKEADNDQPIFLALHGAGIPWLVGDRSVAIGYFGEPSNRDGTRMWSLESGRGDAARVVRTSAQELKPGQPALLVLRVTLGTTESTLDLYINPDPNSPEPPAKPDVTQTLPTRDLIFRCIGLTLGDTNDQGSMGMVRLSATYPAALGK
jgi:hypothetical protein